MIITPNEQSASAEPRLVLVTDALSRHSVPPASCHGPDCLRSVTRR
jgi:hypothetical protein